MARQAFLAGTCAALTDDVSALADMLTDGPGRSAFVIRPERIASAPLGPAVRWEDGHWLALVRAAHAALLDAAERGLTQANAHTLLRTGAEPTHPAYLRLTAPVARALGIVPGWAAQAVEFAEID